MTVRLPEDILYMICEQLAAQRDYDTLLAYALASRGLSHTALPWLYRICHNSPVKGGGSETLPIAQQQLVVYKWSILWRSIVVSSLDRGNTFLPYCRYMRALDLRDLAQLLEDDKFRGKTASNFFAGSLARFNMVLEGPRGRQKRQKRLHITAVINAIGDAVVQKTPMLEQIAGNVLSHDLGRWGNSLERLRSLELWDGRALEDEDTRKTIQRHCPNFSSLSIYEWSGDRTHADHKLASFIAGLRHQSLEFFKVISNAGIGKESCQALCSHRESLKELRLNLQKEAVPHIAILRDCVSLAAIQLSEVGSSRLEIENKDAYNDIVSWLQRCANLRVLNLSHFVSGPSIVTRVLLSEDAFQLRRLELDGYCVRTMPTTHEALKGQRQLQALYLRGESGVDLIPVEMDMFVDSLCEISSLRVLELRGVSDDFSNPEIIKLAECLPELVDLYVSGHDVTDAVLEALGRLRHLRNLTLNAFSSFTMQGLRSYVASLNSPGNEGIVVSVEMAEPESALEDWEQQLVRKELAERVNGQFEYTLFRDPDISEFEDLSD